MLLAKENSLCENVSVNEKKYGVLSKALCPRGGTRSIHDGGGGGSDRASYWKPKEIHKPDTLEPKKYLASIITVFPEHTSLKKSSNEYFSDPLIATKTRNEKFARG